MDHAAAVDLTSEVLITLARLCWHRTRAAGAHGVILFTGIGLGKVFSQQVGSWVTALSLSDNNAERNNTVANHVFHIIPTCTICFILRDIRCSSSGGLKRLKFPLFSLLFTHLAVAGKVNYENQISFANTTLGGGVSLSFARRRKIWSSHVYF
jgi:hypothetical protein